MLERILLPTDGSPLSEHAVPFAETLARAHHAEVFAVRVVEPLVWAGYDSTGYVAADVYQDMVEAIEQEASDVLEGTAGRLRASGVPVQTILLRGTVAASLLDYESSLRPDLVVMSTHGRTGLARFALGSIADLMVRQGTAPVLLVRPFSPAESALETALVPLDGSATAEAALPMVETLAGKPLHRVRLLRAVGAPEQRPEAMAYLDQIAARLSTSGLQLQSLVEVETPQRAIAHAAGDVDLVILSTHGRGGLDRLRHGSVAEQASRHLETPTLLVRAQLTPASAPSTAATVAAS